MMQQSKFKKTAAVENNEPQLTGPRLLCVVYDEVFLCSRKAVNQGACIRMLRQ